MAQRGRKPKDYSKLIAEYKSKKFKVAELAKRHGITVQYMYQVLERNGVEKHNTRHDISYVNHSAVIHDYVNTNMTPHEINKKHGLPPLKIYKILADHGIEKRKRNKPIPPEVEEKVTSLFKRGMTIPTIASTTSLERCVVRDSLVRNGAYAPKRFDDVRVEWKKLYEAGETMTEIAARYGVCIPTVRNHLLIQGVELRDFRRHKRRGRSAV